MTETNQYAAECLKDTNKEWKTNSEEIRAYLGFTVLMGIVQEPEMRDYWVLSPFLHYSPIASKISRKRFEEISRYFHLVDNSTLPRRGEPGYHCLQKVKKVMDMVKERFKEVYTPGICICVDEAMIPFKGEYYYI